MRTHTLALALVATLAGTPARAQTSREDRALAQFDEANRAFHAGRYGEALAHLRAGYKLDARPELLIAIAQTYREMGRIDEAIESCERFLSLSPSGPLHEQVVLMEQRMRDENAHVKAALAPVAAPPAAAAPAVDEPLPHPAAAPAVTPVAVRAAPAVEAPAALSVAPLEAAAAVHGAPAASGPSRRTKIVVGVLAGVASVALGVGLGVGLGVESSAPATHLGTVPFHH